MAKTRTYKFEVEVKVKESDSPEETRELKYPFKVFREVILAGLNQYYSDNIQLRDINAFKFVKIKAKKG